MTIRPISPEDDDSVNDGVPSVHVGVEPSTDAGGVQVRWRLVPVTTELNPEVEEPDSTLNEDLFSVRDSKCTSEILKRKIIQNPFRSQNPFSAKIKSSDIILSWS